MKTQHRKLKRSTSTTTKTWDEPKDDQRRQLQKPGMNLNMTNVNHYKTCDEPKQVFEVVYVGHQ
jgi:hypothetical protein